MSDFIKRKYALAEPGSGVTVFHMDSGEINLFGSHTIIKTSEFDVYSPIEDFLIQKLVEEKSDTMYNIGVTVTTALTVIAGAAIFCALTVATGGTALVLGGIGVASGVAAIKTGDYTYNTLASDKETGYDRSWQEFYQDLNKNVVEGALTGALIYGGILLFIDTAAMSTSLMESFLNASPAFAEVGAIGQEAAVTAIPNLDALVSAASFAALYEVSQLGKGGKLQGDKEGVHFEKDSSKSVKPESAVKGSKKHGVKWKEGPARAKATGKPQGQWAQSDLDYATEMANKLEPGESGYFELPEGSQSVVHMPDGNTQPATRMWIRNNGTGTWHGYPMP